MLHYGAVHTQRDFQIPWAALGRQQVQVEIDRLYLLAVPSYQQDALPPENMENEDERLEEVKRMEVLAQEKLWVDSMRASEHVDDPASPGYLQGLINVVLGNLKIKVGPVQIADRKSGQSTCEPPVFMFLGHQSPHQIRRHRHTTWTSFCIRHHTAQHRRFHR